MQIKDTEMMRLQIDRLIGSVFLDFYAIGFILFLLSIFLDLGFKKKHLYSTEASCEIEGEPPRTIFELLRIETNISRNMHTFILLESYLLSHDSSLSQQSTFSRF